MRWRNRQQSSNVDDRRSRGGEGPRLPSIGAILFLWPVVKTLFRSKIGLAILGVAALAYFGGILPLPLLDGGGARSSMKRRTASEPPLSDRAGDTEAVWSGIFAKAGARYPVPTLVLYAARPPVAAGCEFPHGAFLLPGGPEGVCGPRVL